MKIKWLLQHIYIKCSHCSCRVTGNELDLHADTSEKILILGSKPTSWNSYLVVINPINQEIKQKHIQIILITDIYIYINATRKLISCKYLSFDQEQAEWLSLPQVAECGNPTMWFWNPAKTPRADHSQLMKTTPEYTLLIPMLPFLGLLLIKSAINPFSDDMIEDTILWGYLYKA